MKILCFFVLFASSIHGQSFEFYEYLQGNVKAENVEDLKITLTSSEKKNLHRLKELNPYYVVFKFRSSQGDTIPHEIFSFSNLKHLYLQSDSFFILPEQLLWAKSLKNLIIVVGKDLRPNQHSFFYAEEQRIFWPNLPDLETIEEIEPGHNIAYFPKQHILEIIKVRENFDFVKIPGWDKIEKLYLVNEFTPIPDSVFCAMPALKELYSASPIPDCLHEVKSLQRIETEKMNSARFKLDISKFIYPDTIILTPWVPIGRPKLSQIADTTRNLKYVFFYRGNCYPKRYNEKFSFDGIYLNRLRKKLGNPTFLVNNTYLMRGDKRYNFYREWLRFLFSSFMRFGIEGSYQFPGTGTWAAYYQIGFTHPKTEFFEKIYKSSPHVFSMGGGMAISPGYIRGLLVWRYDYYLPWFPLFLGNKWELYMDGKNRDYRAYFRPHLGFAIIPKEQMFPGISFWYGYGVPLAKRPMDAISAHEIGVRFTLPLPHIAGWYIPGFGMRTNGEAVTVAAKSGRKKGTAAGIQ